MDAPPIRRMVVPIDNLTSVLDKVSLIRHLQSLSNRDRDAWFVWDKAVGDDASHEVDHEVGDRAMTGVLDLAQVFQLVKDGFDDAALAQDGLIELGQGPGFMFLRTLVTRRMPRSCSHWVSHLSA